MNVGVIGAGGVAEDLLWGLFASENPHWGQNVACRRTSVLHCGQRKVEADTNEGCNCGADGVADISRDA